ncbi:dynein regulatory complex protein 9 [Cherax quadricarinatus]|uniref:dynein regulatory complex protein 9 n=1 Tax=Cherax quadricarinatus TaxID=27406 RepID=UPI002377E821|nr:dynein regulatory complex protein 9-like [Cherax quadricarinatus]
MTLEYKTAIKFSQICKKAALSICVMHELLPGCPFRPADGEETDLSENENDRYGNDLALRKLHDDLGYIEKILFDLANELVEKQSFSCLEKCIAFEKEDHKKKADFIALLQGHKWKAKHFQKSSKVHGLQKDLKNVKQDTQKLLQAKDQEISDLLMAISDAKRLNPKREAYERKVARVQIENLQFRIEQEEQSICKEIAKVGREIPQEIRVHDALTAFLKESCAKLETKILEWEEKFKEDTQKKREEVAKWQAEVQSKQSTLNEVIQKYEEYLVVVQDYEAEQEVERQRKELEDLKQRAAARIQAWWKGYLVRRGMSSGVKKKNKKNKQVKK